MKVCAHINYGPFSNGHRKFDTVAAAVDYFTTEVVDSRYRDGVTGDDGCYVMDLYSPFDQYSGEECECDSAMNFHDYPNVRYSVGPRGGLVRERC